MACGALVMVHGSDSQAGVGTLISGTDCSAVVIDASLGGNTWIQCYSQGANVGFVAASAGPTRFVGCGAEDFFGLAATSGANHSVVGGSLASFTTSQLAVETLGEGLGRIAFSRTDPAGVVMSVQIPTADGVADSPVYFTRDDGTGLSAWYFAYEYAGYTAYPFMAGSYLLKHQTNGVIDTDVYGGPFGMTEPGNARGNGLAIIGTPTMNSQRRWTYKQSVTLIAGTSVYWLQGNGSGGPGSGFPFADDGTVNGVYGGPLWVNSNRRVIVTVELPPPIVLASAPTITVNAYQYSSTGAGTSDVSVSITTGGGSNISGAVLVWYFETFVQNWASGGTDIG